MEMMKGSLNMKAREAGHRKPFLEQTTGDDFFRKAQKWVERVMRIDRRNDRYTEHVVDPHTNETFHYCDEPLSAHQGHDSAKNKTSNELRTRCSGRPRATEPMSDIRKVFRTVAAERER